MTDFPRFIDFEKEVIFRQRKPQSKTTEVINWLSDILILANSSVKVNTHKIDFTTMPDNKYSTDEINTGKKWINGKTIFQKTFAMGGLGRATTIKKPHNISNLDLVIRIQGIAKENSIGATINLPHAADQQPYTVTVYADNTNVNIQTYADQSGYAQSYVTLWYTKK